MPDDAAEVVRLAGLMSESMGIDPSHGSWAKRGENAVKNHVAAEVAVFVTDHPDLDGRFATCAAAVMAERLPTPANELGLVAYVQWVCTDPQMRPQGLGRQVMLTPMRWCDEQGARSIELHATPVAEPMYLSLGFADDGPRALRRRQW